MKHTGTRVHTYTYIHVHVPGYRQGYLVQQMDKYLVPVLVGATG